MQRRALITSLLILALAVPAIAFAPAARAQSDDYLAYFPETGHGVREPFIAFYNSAGGVRLFGFPITDDYVDKDTGLLVQYFQKARLEWHPGNPDPYKIQLGLLGDELGRRMPPIPVSQIPSPSDPNCRYFPEIGHSLCLKFLEHWLSTGGLDLYGYPISEFTIENGRIVQYFQRAKMEWHPEKPEGHRIQLAPLGVIYYDYARLDPARLKANPVSAYYKPVALKLRASVLSPVVAPGAVQTGYLHVSDQLGNPLAGAAVTLIVRDPEGKASHTLPPTNANGITVYSFPVSQAKAGTVVSMEFVVILQGIVARTRTSYMVWFY